jgi:5'-methylthioadenosine phosphorylase
MSLKPLLAVIGGSGLYNFEGLEDTQTLDIATPFGKPSAPLVVGRLDGLAIAFLARHGIGHLISPTEVNYRANIYALKSLGVERVVSVSACGSLREDFAPGHLVVPDQIFDFTRDRKRTFFEDGLVAHISTADPLCADLSGLVVMALRYTGATVHSGGTLITVEGPRFSTKAESNLYRAWGLSIIGMTASPEVFLAREAEMCYATLAHVTDYDVWRTSEEPVTVEMVIRVLNQNTHLAQDAIRRLLHLLAEGPASQRTCPCGSALKDALITQPESIPAATLKKLDLLVGKYLGQ